MAEGAEDAGRSEPGNGPAQWAAVDEALTMLLAPEDDALRAAVEESERRGLPTIQVSALQGKLLMLLARMLRPRAILEVGTLGGYSTIWLARALEPGGRVVTLELEPHHAVVAGENLRRAGVADRVEVRVGPAAESLRALISAGAGPYDLVFLDADKPSNPEYLELALRLSRPGTVIIADNVVREGAIIDETTDDPSVLGTRRFHQLLATHPELDATVVQTVGSKGYDGFALAIVGLRDGGA